MSMRIKQLALLLALVLAASTLSGCAFFRDRRDAPWDPKSGTLFDQIPAWEGGANRVCGGHLDAATRVKEGRSPRC